ncbi:hypothetical protein N7539_001155 [Penicillium diatomitis]|uniref:Csf1 N-terminal domain-containing protein n=1 Tax=Penicillium diatomitis TaxID=2819901 RepID=A0A9W9XPK8_9EURO|nr:uncharacterized protein N7539_001155 [Penicillium diatomitis]KAJ5496039.1 hypothetical protein N7539_001155 [Penicillium diatomitis]
MHSHRAYWKRTVARTNLAREPNANEAEKSSFGSNPSCPEDNLSDSTGEQGGIRRTFELPCRISLTIYGLEWFIYNRTPAYDNILAGFGYKQPFAHDEHESERRPTQRPSEARFSEESCNLRSRPAARPANDRGCEPSPDAPNSPGSRDAKAESPDTQGPVSHLLQLLPVKLECKKGAIVMGNENTRSVLTVTFDNAEGTIAACRSGPLDLYRQLFNLKFEHPVIHLKPNPDFKQNQIDTAKTLSATHAPDSDWRRGGKRSWSFPFRKRKLWHSIRGLVPYFQSSVESFASNAKQAGSNPRRQTQDIDMGWTGLSRFLDETSDDDHNKWNSVEYGRYSTILDSPCLHVTYFWDVPGRVGSQVFENETSSNINNALPPQWGLDLRIEGGTINYGPWADRERIGLQNVFFPNFYRDSEPAEQLAPGVLRQSTVFKLRLEVDEDLTLRIPSREPSKDWQWKGRADAVRGASTSRSQGEKRRLDQRRPRRVIWELISALSDGFLSGSAQIQP